VDLAPVMLSDVIAKECQQKTFSAYTRGLSHSSKQDLTINEAFAMGVPVLRAWLASLPTVGFVAVSEIMKAIDKYDSMSAKDAREHFFGGAEVYRATNKLVNGAYAKQGKLLKKMNKHISNITPDEDDIASPESFFNFCRTSLTGAAGEVIGLRYRDNGLYTLEEVGDVLGVTRERVRQIEKKAFQIITDYLSDALSVVYEKHKERITKKIFGLRFLIPVAAFPSEFKKLNIYDIFLIEAKFGSLRGWAEIEFQKQNGSYIKDKKELINATKFSDRINETIKSCELPVPVEIFAKISKLSFREVMEGILVEEKLTIYSNYIIEKKTATTRVRRAINAHLLLTKFSRIDEIKGIELTDLAALYRENFQDDRCSSRDLDIVFVQYPHLFLKLYEYGWIAINPEVEIDKSLFLSRNELSIDVESAKRRENDLYFSLFNLNSQNIADSEESKNQRRENIKALIKLGKNKGYLNYKDLEVIGKEIPESDKLKAVINVFKNIGIPIHGGNLEFEGEGFESAHGLNDDQDVTILGLLQKILSSGAMRFEDLRRNLVSGSNNVYSRASTGPVLINNQDVFMRYAPSIYGLRGSENDFNYLKNARNLLLETDQCEIYCLAAMAGVGVGAYPLWDYQMEYKWATWLSKLDQSELMSSLLFVANPEEWPCDDWDRRKWIERKAQLSYFGLREKNRFTILETEVSIYQVVTAAITSVIEGFTSWALINRAIGARLDDRHSQSLLALLVYLGIAERGVSWQDVHKLSFGAKAKTNRFLENYSRYLLDGESKSLYESIEEHVDDSVNLGWVDRGEISELHIKILGLIKTSSSVEDVQIDTKNAINQTSLADEIKSALLSSKIEKSWKI
jgi:hypothetical protein